MLISFSFAALTTLTTLTSPLPGVNEVDAGFCIHRYRRLFGVGEISLSLLQNCDLAQSLPAIIAIDLPLSILNRYLQRLKRYSVQTKFLLRTYDYVESLGTSLAATYQ